MTRGKHGRAAAQRRAQSAEDQLDRLLPQLHEAKRKAEQYRSEAEAAPVLRRQLAQLKDVIGVPVTEHEETVTALQARHRTELTKVQDACVALFDEFARWVVLDKEEWINAHLVRTLQTLPRPIADAFFRSLGIDRDTARMMLAADPNAISKNSGTSREMLLLSMRAEAAGYEHGKVPASMVRGLDDSSNPDYQYKTRPDTADTGTVEECKTDFFEAIDWFIEGRDHDSSGVHLGDRLRRVYDTQANLAHAMGRTS